MIRCSIFLNAPMLVVGAFFIILSRSPTKEVIAILTTKYAGSLDPEQLKELIEQSLDADKAENIETIDLRNQTAIADYMIVATGTSSRQVAALAEKLQDRLKARGMNNIRTEGLAEGNWVVLDAGDIIVHLFRPEVREFYNIEKMWRTPHTQNVATNVQRL